MFESHQPQESFIRNAVLDVLLSEKMHQGDILLTGQPKEKPLVEVDSHLEGVICGHKLTEFNVK